MAIEDARPQLFAIKPRDFQLEVLKGGVLEIGFDQWLQSGDIVVSEALGNLHQGQVGGD
ncbi:hypothetical protein D3C71_1997280 [compost metagenome]